MGWIDAILGSVASFGQQALQNRYNSKEAQKNRDFQSVEAAAQRNWSAAQAEQAQDWNEEMFEKYNSLSGKIAQAEKAGVNPLFAITGNATTPAPTSAPVPSGASAGSVGNPTSAFVDLVGNLLGLSKLKSEIALTEAEADRIKSETPYSVQKLMSEIANLDIRSELTGAQIDNVLADTRKTVQSVENLKSELRVTDEQANNIKASTDKLISEFETINALRDSQVRSSQAKSAIDEYEASISKFIDSMTSEGKANVDDFVKAITKILYAKFVN